jgi:hypothetical protein
MKELICTETKISYKVGAGTYTEIEGLIDVPEMGGSRDKVDVTNLSDKIKRSVYGLKDMGELTFKFNYDNSTVTANYRVLKGIEDADSLASFQVTYPDESTHVFDAYIHVKLDGAKVGSVLQFSVTMLVQTDITVTNPI